MYFFLNFGVCIKRKSLAYTGYKPLSKKETIVITLKTSTFCSEKKLKMQRNLFCYFQILEKLYNNKPIRYVMRLAMQHKRQIFILIGILFFYLKLCAVHKFYLAILQRSFVTS